MSKIKNHKAIVRSIHKERIAFGASFVMVLFVSFSLLSVMGVTPSESDESIIGTVQAEDREPTVVLTKESDTVTEADTTPTRVVIESVGIDVTIENPQSRDIAVLDEALLSGAVHYPGSGNLDDHSNMFLFGHSSFLPSVNNESFRAFNNLEKVKKGALIRIESNDIVNIYRVEDIKLIDADEALVELSDRERKLTLSTCNSFGAPGDRYIVEASFVGNQAL